MADKNIIEMLRKNDPQWLNEFVDTYCNKMFGMLAGHGFLGADADAIWWVIVYQVWRKAHTFEGRSSFSSWVYRVAYNICLMEHRKRKSTDTAAAAIDEMAHLVHADYGFSKRIEARETLRVIAGRIQHPANSDDANRITAFTLHCVCDLPNADAAAAVGETVGAFKSRVHRAKAHILRGLKAA